MRLGPHHVDLLARVLTTAVGPVDLTEIEAGLLDYLAQRGGHPVPREELLQQVWGYAPGVRSRTVDTTIGRLRAKIEPDPARPTLLVTVRGRGYALHTGAPSPSSPTPPTSLPIPRLDAIRGRTSEVRTLASALHSGHRLLTLTGPSGIGKTWLARHFLTGVCEEGRRATWFADATGARTTGELLDAMAEALCLARPLVDPAAQVGTALGALGPNVGVLDDAQDLDDDALRVVSSWVRTHPDVAVLVTSQRLLGLEGERRCPVELLALPASISVLRDRCAALALTPPPGPELSALAERVGGLPLALDLAASMLDMGTVKDLLDDDNPLAWSSSRPDAPQRHRSLKAAIEASVVHLTAAERQALLTLSVFAGPFPRSASEAMGVRGGLTTLLRRSFLFRLPDGRMSLYDGVRHWARDRLRSQGEWTRAAHTHARWLQAQVLAESSSLTLPDLLQALTEGPPPETLDPLLAAVLSLVGRKGPIGRIPEVLAPLLRRDPPPRATAQISTALSTARRMAGTLNPELATRAWTLAQEHGHPREAVQALIELSAVTCAMGDFRTAQAHGREAMALAASLGDPMLRYLAVEYTASALSSDRDPSALEMHRRAAAIARAAGLPIQEAISLANAANNLGLAGELDAAITAYGDAIEAVGDRHPRFRAVVHINLGGRLAEVGRIDEARASFSTSHRLLRAIGDPVLLAELELRAIDVDFIQGKTARALRRLRALDGDPALPPRRQVSVAICLAVLENDRNRLDPQLVRDDPMAGAAQALLDGRSLPPDLPRDVLRRITLLASMIQ